MMNTLNRSLIVDPLARIHSADDPTDAFLLDLAVAASADYLVTGDKQAGLLQLGKIRKTRIVTAVQFCNDVLKLKR
jgi:predicted nucleic acid-binding protein